MRDSSNRCAQSGAMTCSQVLITRGTITVQPKKFQDPLICLLNVELELKSEKDNAEVRIKEVAVSVFYTQVLWKAAGFSFEITYRTTKLLSMRSGKSSMTSWTPLLPLAPKWSCHGLQSETWPHSTLPIETFSVLVV